MSLLGVSFLGNEIRVTHAAVARHRHGRSDRFVTSHFSQSITYNKQQASSNIQLYYCQKSLQSKET
jgi:hypothetical protein